MTELRMTEQEIDDNQNRVLSFGEHLYVERKKQNLSVADVAKAIHLSEKVIDAVERSDIDQLPQPAFVKGYLNAYAKYLGISAALVLEEYSQAVPHQKEADLRSRSMLAGEADSNSPLVKMITVLLLLLMLLAAGYASFSYYKDAIVVSDVESQDETLLSLSEIESLEQDASGYDDFSESYEQASIDQHVEIDQATAKLEPVVSEVVNELESSTSDADAVLLDDAANQKPTNQMDVEGGDDLEISTIEASWVEVDDANNENLYYDLLQDDQRIKLIGTAPFKIFLGNAPQVKIKINDVSVDVEKYIRSNNIAHFSISVDQQQVVFH